jgi:hypothetical protein
LKKLAAFWDHRNVSEFSSSIHIQTADAVETEKALLEAGYRGLVFGPKNGWLTFVPYADGDADIDQLASFSPRLSEAVGATILHYTYAEDHFWSFAVVRAGKATCVFACGWDPKLEVSRDRLDMAVVQAFASSTDIEPFLKDRICEGRPSAYGFAKVLGLPAYEWLSPLLVEKDTQYFLKRGGRRLGRKKPGKKTRLPEPIEIITPGGDLSAREALEIVRTHTPFLDASWLLYNVNGHAHRDIDHTKLAVPQSDWEFRYLNTKTGERVNAGLFVKENAGRIGFRSYDRVSQIELSEHPQLGLPTNWIDSSRVAQIVQGIELPKEVKQPDATLFSLWGTSEAFWKVFRSSNRISWQIEIDAVTGEVLRETVGWCDEDDYIVKHRRGRLRGGAWRDL